jgi:hypothetical protein
VKPGALLPKVGNSPEVWSGLPWNFIVAMINASYVKRFVIWVGCSCAIYSHRSIREVLNKSFDKLSATAPCVALPPASMQLRTNGNLLIPSW